MRKILMILYNLYLLISFYSVKTTKECVSDTFFCRLLILFTVHPVDYSLSNERSIMAQHSSISDSEIVSGGEMRKAVSQ